MSCHSNRDYRLLVIYLLLVKTCTDNNLEQNKIVELDIRSSSRRRSVSSRSIIFIKWKKLQELKYIQLYVVHRLIVLPSQKLQMCKFSPNMHRKVLLNNNVNQAV